MVVCFVVQYQYTEFRLSKYTKSGSDVYCLSKYNSHLFVSLIITDLKCCHSLPHQVPWVFTICDHSPTHCNFYHVSKVHMITQYEMFVVLLVALVLHKHFHLMSGFCYTICLSTASHSHTGIDQDSSFS